MHVSSGRWVYGLFLALLTALLWGILPIKLKQVLQVMDPVTVTWFRLTVSGGCLLAYLAAADRCGLSFAGAPTPALGQELACQRRRLRSYPCFPASSMFSGRTQASNCSSVRYPSSSAASRRVRFSA